MAVVTDDSRSRLRGSLLPVGFLAIIRPSMLAPDRIGAAQKLEFRRATR
jgi:hypothetical protein